MIELRRLLCPVDFSEPSRCALRHAIALARRYRSEVTVLYVEDALQTSARAEISLGASFFATAEDSVRAFVDATPGGIAANIRVATRFGGAVTGILEQAVADSSDLIVMGTRGRSGLARAILGSVTDSVLRRASCPVMTIPPAADGPANEDVEAFDPILCASDF
ncbi:MAG: universal stress protein, partial [Thermoanaerobaculia bacterium]